jgi:DNA damage-binding protein 1
LAIPATFSYDLETGERASSIESLTLFGRPFFALGTGIIDRSKAEVQQGRILLFGETPGGGKVELVSEFATGGGVFALSWLEGKGKLAASVNSRVSSCPLPLDHIQALNYSPLSLQVLLLDVGSDHQLTKSAIWGSAYMPASLAPIDSGARLLVGDAMSSMSVVDVGDESLRTIAKDARPLWMTTVAPLSDEVMIGGDVSPSRPHWRCLCPVSDHPLILTTCRATAIS